MTEIKFCSVRTLGKGLSGGFIYVMKHAEISHCPEFLKPQLLISLITFVDHGRLRNRRQVVPLALVVHLRCTL